MASKINQVWQQAHESLLARKWTVARPLLEELSKSHDILDYLLKPDQYPDVPQFIADRIDAVNAKVDRNHSDRDTAWQLEQEFDELYEGYDAYSNDEKPSCYFDDEHAFRGLS